MIQETYRGWSIYYSPYPRPLWTATKGLEKDLYSYESIENLKKYINQLEDEHV